ncbi:glycosyltransferase family 4 protein [Flavobacterium humi]|uniref:Glycosyltransferase family 4 protein n=1 Tax=Flavobacterium humi TaxID=2562683 RepID=A0A4Z0L493_9FLAO|nr:glycosyltransferase family 4 protein [Flavobacterium humi]TGD57163.1 glycosyltransferase family 4 protein [Flavobacterium humi]
MASGKIAIYSGEIPSTTFVERLIEGLAASGYEVCLFGQLKRKKDYAGRVTTIGYRNTLEKLWHFVSYSVLLTVSKSKNKKKLDQLLARQKKNTIAHKAKYYPVLYHHPDIFHLQWAKSTGDWEWVQEFGIKLVLSLRGTHVTISPIGDSHWARLYRHAFPKIDAFHAVSNAIGHLAEQYGADPAKIKTVYSGMDFQKLPFVAKDKINTPLKVISIGRSHWVKGYHYALDAFALLQQQSSLFEYTVIGIEATEELLVQRAQSGLENKVHFVGQIAFDSVLPTIRSADVVLLSSVEEGIANVVLEAMALGTLVVSTDCGGMSEVITDGENGFLVPVRNPLAIAEALLKVSGLSLHEYQKIAVAARKTVENQHSQAKMMADMEALYQTVLEVSP